MSAAPQANNPDITLRNEASKGAGGKKGLPKLVVVIGVTLLNVLVLGGSVAFFVLTPKEAPAKASKASEKDADEGDAAEEPPEKGGKASGEEGGEEKDGAQPRPMVKVDNVTVRLRNLEVDRYARATFEFETMPNANVPKIQNAQPKVRDAILTLLADRAYEDLAGSAGLAKLKADIMEKAVQIFGEKQVSGVYVSEFILQ